MAGGGSFVTLPALMLTGLDARMANVASTLALFPAQATTGWVGRRNVADAGALPFRALAVLSLGGGAVGAALLLSTPSAFFARLVPWLVLFATLLFAWGSFVRGRPVRANRPVGPAGAAVTQVLIAVYGGYFGGGVGFLMLAALTLAGQSMRTAGATKNVLAAVMNASAVAVFAFTPHLPWPQVTSLGAGAVLGGYAGARLLDRVDERIIRVLVVTLGLCLTVGLFLRAA